MNNEIKNAIINDLNNAERLDYAIEDIKKEYKLTDAELLPIYNEWFFNKEMEVLS